ncbi:DUF6056 family protein [Streptomyces qinzhouensis]|uniref:Uncharacterized protein n=1 Tax=Streptomyces qinzhouensis TaxID=2599401 RepID=A0A5B8IFQ4_9ACTN|nr:DUF6056 family protein [Streptomyces qinzhouensis]QDY77418.1 hypothetical protein FQU76_13785 [Streptomyces qinzhouensis]
MATSIDLPTPPPDDAPAPESGGPGKKKGPADYWPLALAALPLGLLALAMWFGRHVRPSADEWCFLPDVREDGMWGLVHTFYFTDNGRVANGILVGAYTKFPVAGHQWYGPISGALMLLLLWAVTATLLRRTGTRVPRGVPLLAAGMITAVFLFATPNTYKTFYWPAASVSHTLAPVLAAAAAVPLLRARGRRGEIAALVVVVLAGVFMGTLSEEASVVALVVLSGVVLFAGLLLVERYRRPARIWALAGMGGIAIGTIILVTSPGSRNRRSRFGAENVSMLAPESLWGSAKGFAEILGTVVTTWQYVGAVAAGVVIGLLARRDPEAPRVLRPVRPGVLLGLGAAAFLIAGYLCTVITYPVFGHKVVTTERTWNDYLLLWAFLLVAAGAFLGRWLSRRFTAGTETAPADGTAVAASRRNGTLAVALAAAVCAVTVGSLASGVLRLGDDMRARAVQWDRQDTYLREGAARGEKVMPYTPTKISRMLEPYSRNGTRAWPAQCVAEYYKLDRVTYARTFQGD